MSRDIIENFTKLRHFYVANDSPMIMMAAQHPTKNTTQLMKKIASLLMSIALTSAAVAGPYTAPSSKGGKIVNPPVEPPCFGAGLSLGVNASALYPKDGKAGYGGGVLAEYFFCENFGIQGSYNIVDKDNGLHIFNLDLVLRAPIQSICLAPYLLVGGGLHVDGSTFGTYQVGGGLEYKLKGSNIGIFADGTYNWHASGHSDENYTLVRLGLKFSL
jgi:hypothetical protein